MEALLKTESLGKTYQRKSETPVTVLSKVDFTVNAGDRIAIIGKSGAGKSTLLHILGTLEEPSTGQVRFLGKDIFRFSESALSEFRNRELGFVFQFHYLMLEFNALENVMMPALIARASRAEAKERAMKLLKRVGLSDRMTHKPNQLSGGEQQRVAIARAMVMRPKILLTDEMTGNLDPQTARQVFDLVKEIQEEFQIALISVTHDTALAASYPRIYRLDAGMLQGVAS